MSLCLRVIPLFAVLALPACKAPDVPRSPAPWITLGASKGTVTSLDTSRIVLERSTRVVWVRQKQASGQTETRHRVDCGARTVTDLDSGPTRPFGEHPYGKRVFATVCNALGNLATKR